MSDTLSQLRLAHWHAQKCLASIARARPSVGDDLVPGDGDITGDDDLGPLLPGGAVEPNPQRSRRDAYLRLIKSAAAIRGW
jgi:hypothetical protein